MNLPLYNISLFDDECGVYTISIVDEPAVEVEMITFKEDKVQLMFDEEKKYITSVVCRADFPIYRRSERMGEYMIKFSKEAILQMVERYSKNNFINNVSLNHSGEDIQGLTMIESYITDQFKKSPFDVEEGSWIATFKCENQQVWDDIKAGKLHGFSLEGLFELEKVETQISNQAQHQEPEKQDESKDDFESFVDEFIK